MTLSANAPHYLIAFLLLPTLLLLRVRKPEDGTPLPSSQANISSMDIIQSNQQIASSNVVVGKSTFAPLPALTTYRAHMMLMTVLAILAVDFPVFPRSLVKCETYGVSLVRLNCALNRTHVGCLYNLHRWIWVSDLLFFLKALFLLYRWSKIHIILKHRSCPSFLKRRENHCLSSYSDLSVFCS